MIIQTTALVLRGVPSEGLTLQRVWHLDQTELSVSATAVLQALSSDQSASDIATHTAWLSQAVLEFQDVQPLIMPQEGRFLNRNYLFHEALAALRECVLSGLNGSYHASFAVLRSALELFLSHYWWRKRLQGEGSYEEFHRWLFGELSGRNDPSSGFRKLARETYAGLSLPSSARDQIAITDIYAKLCSYSHKPILAEATTTLKGGNESGASLRATSYWLELLTEALACLLDFAIANHPQAVFPVDVCRKFGFNTPVGALIDQYSFVPIAAALGASRSAEYQRYYRTQATPALQLYEAQADLSNDEIMASWTEGGSLDDDEDDFETRLFHRVDASKANTRAILLSFSYGAPPHSLKMKDGKAEVSIWGPNGEI